MVMGKFLNFFRNTYRTYGQEQKRKVVSLYEEVIENGNRVREKAQEALVLAGKINGNGQLH